MALRPSTMLPRIGALVVLGLLATATLTFAAERRLQASATPKPAVATPAAATLVVPDVRGQVYVFAEGILEDAGFGWRVAGANGFATNLVVAQSPPPGTKVVDTGAPLVLVSLTKGRGYRERGTPVNVSPFRPTALRLAGSAAASATKTTSAAPQAAQKPAAVAAPAKKAATHAARKPDFVVKGARAEPADEVPLITRAHALDAWLDTHKQKTNANVRYWLFQNAWIVTGAKLGWWHGAQALRVLIAADRKTQNQWGLGAKSEALARAALAEVEARAR